MRTKPCPRLYTYWNDVRRDRLAPRRFDIEPSSIADILPDTFILQRETDGDLRYRLAGTRIAELLGLELRGRSFLAPWREDDRVELRPHIRETCQLGGVLAMTLEAGDAAGEAVEAEAVLMPLTHTGDAIERYLGALAPLSKPPPGRGALTGWRLLAHTVIWPDGRPHSIVERLSRQSPLRPHVRTARIVRFDRRQFRVYDGGLAGREES